MNVVVKGNLSRSASQQVVLDHISHSAKKEWKSIHTLYRLMVQLAYICHQMLSYHHDVSHMSRYHSVG